MSTDFERLVKAHDTWRSLRCINLIPSENAMSPDARALLSSDLATRYSLPLNMEVHGVVVENAYRGVRYSEELSVMVNDLAGRTLGAKHAFLDPLSGHLAAMLMLLATCKKGDLLLCPDSRNGGYDGYCVGYLPDILGLRVCYLPYNEKEGTVDAEAAADEVRRKRPALVVLGASYIPFQHPVRELSDACEDAGCRLGYDGAHILGIMPAFQHPLKEGADILVGNTHKTFWGPQGGIAMTDDEELAESIRRNLTWRIMDNTHLNRIAATGQALLEWKRHGRKYAIQVVRNSRRLGRELDSLGYPLRYGHRGFSASHQLCLDHRRFRRFSGTDINAAAKRLESQNIITDAVGRLGVQEVTRMGLREADMGELASIIAAGTRGERVARRAASLRGRMKMEYTLRAAGLTAPQSSSSPPPTNPVQRTP
jgi:glycine hydroxymethyltransferase